MKTAQRVLITLVSCAAAVYVGRILFRQEADRTSKEHYQYDVSEYRRVQAELVRYRETGRIETGMKQPRGIAVGATGNVYMAGDRVVVVFGGHGKKMPIFRLESAPGCIAIGPNGMAYVGMERHVEVYTPQGTREASWPSLGEKAVVTSIAAAKDDVFVADYGNRVVWRFDIRGTLKGKIGEGAFVIPSPYFDVAIGPDGALWAANTGKRRLERYSFDGKLEGSWGEASMELDGFSGCCNPSHFAVRSDGWFVTCEKGLERVKLHDSKGAFSCVVAAPDHFAEGTVGMDVAVDSDGRILVLDPAARVVRIFEEKKDE